MTKRRHRAVPTLENGNEVLEAIKQARPFSEKEMLEIKREGAALDIVNGHLYGIGGIDTWKSLSEIQKGSLIEKRMEEYCNGARPLGTMHTEHVVAKDSEGKLRWWEVVNGKKERGPGHFDPAHRILKEQEEFKSNLRKIDRAHDFKAVQAPDGRIKGQEARAKKAEATAKSIVSEVERLEREGCPPRNIVGNVVKKMAKEDVKITPRRVRQILKEKRKSQERG